MSNYPIPANEQQRLKALYDYDILDSISEDEYDSITRMAAEICNVPACLITFLDADRQWFKSHLGIEIRETPRAISFCNYTITGPDDVLVVTDLRVDERFAQNPLVTEAPNAVFYAGAPLITPDGYALGSICVLDAKENDLNDAQKEALRSLAKQIVTRLELQKKIKELNVSETKLRKANERLKSFAGMVSHDMKTPLANIILVKRSFKNRYESVLDERANEFLDLIDESAKELLLFIDDVLVRSKKEDDSFREEPSDTRAIIDKVIAMIAAPEDIEITVGGTLPNLFMNHTMLWQVFHNLVSNAVKYNDKEKGIINISSGRNEYDFFIEVSDNGSGIDKDHLSSLFQKGKTFDKTDRFGNKGTGIGLAAIKAMLEEAGAGISVNSVPTKGSSFRVLIPNELVNA